MSIEFEVNSDTRITDRVTYSAIDLFGDLGGVVELCKMLVGFFAVRFSQMRLYALITNRLYHLSYDSRSLIDDLGKDSNSHYLRRRPNGDTEINVPTWLDWGLCRNKYCCCAT